jgi:hypothetical protein
MIPRAAIVAWPLANEELVNLGVMWTSRSTMRRSLAALLRQWVAFNSNRSQIVNGSSTPRKQGCTECITTPTWSR